ncbi:hypothetical protein GY21_08100 [Cryobacterium roopkundense]|uniref:Uncharacterized protein n=1 Tax=Cryobacterium roopkundense TaxID=1001240 RepID=A0A099JFA4_9MICO|nr:hypothetical protein [Cryobacterium roopkundense]KGJ77114.1 hypothetical protein GY21_08100 [Cryobacterium roopkundense]MBB5641518.1 hypothetical protein [Cryobacterium roopkundense]
MLFSFESFHIDGVPVGAIVRELSDRTLTTVTCFQVPGGALVHNESHIEFDQDAFGWTSSSYVEHGEDVRVDIARDNRFARDCVPSYAEWMVIRRMLIDGQAHQSFTTFDDGDFEAHPQAAELSISSRPETVDKSGSPLPTAGRIVLKVNGEVRNRHWFVGTSLVASDWNGARSYPETTLAHSLTGLDSTVRAILRRASV